MKYTIIGSIVYFDTTSKIHIAKEDFTVNTVCGKHLSFNYEPVYISQTKNLIEYSKEELIKIPNLCKKCFKKVQINENAQQSLVYILNICNSISPPDTKPQTSILKYCILSFFCSTQSL